MYLIFFDIHSILQILIIIALSFYGSILVPQRVTARGMASVLAWQCPADIYPEPWEQMASLK